MPIVLPCTHATPRKRVDMGPTEPQGGAGTSGDAEVSDATLAVQEAIAAAESAARPSRSSAGVAEALGETTPPVDDGSDPSAPGAAPA